MNAPVLRFRVLPAIPPVDGRLIDLRVGETHLEWRYLEAPGQEATDWQNLIAIEDITGPKGDDGPSIELRTEEGDVQWRVAGSEIWQFLISISTLTDPPTEQAETARDFAARWASDPEDGTPIDDGTNPVGQSAFHWAKKSEADADRAEGYANSLNLPAIQPGDAGKQLYVTDEEDGYRLDKAARGGGELFPTVAAMLADDNETIGYAGSGAAVTVEAGDIVVAQGFRYEVVASEAVDAHVETAGGVKLKALPGSDGSMCPDAWCPIADGETDDHAVLQAFHIYCEANGYRFVYTAKTYALESTLAIRGDGDASLATFVVDATAVSPALRVGSNSVGDITRRIKVHLPTVSNTAKVETGWAGFEEAIGVELANLYECVVYEREIFGFGIGLKLDAYGGGCVYNTVHMQRIHNNKINLQLRAGDDDGWVNENLFNGGRLSFLSSEGTAVSGTRHIELIESSDEQVHGRPNNNLFIGVSLEGVIPEFQVWCQGSDNTFLNCRWEAAGNPKIHLHARGGADANSNLVLGGYGSHQINFTYSGASSANYNGVLGARRSILKGSGDTLRLSNGSSAGISGRHITGYTPSIDYLNASPTDDVWSYILYAQGLAGKSTEDSSPRVTLSFTNGRLYFGNGSSNPTKYIGNQGNNIGCSVPLVPTSDNDITLGNASFRWSEIFSGNDTINTSDAREKIWHGGLDDAEMRVARRLSKLIGIYQWKSAVAVKGDNARLHCGVTAQDIRDAFEAEGLDGFRYGVLCYDAWGAEDTVEAGDRYGVRYTQLWAFVAAGFEARLSALEG